MINNNIILRQCNIYDVNDILALQDAVFVELGGLEENLRKNSREMFASCVIAPNITLGLFDDEQMIGVAIMVDASGTDEDLSIGLKKHVVKNSANAKLVMIRKKYYGNGFQNAMLWILEKLAHKNGYKYLCATVARENEYSRNNLISSGYEYDHSQKKYGGLQRDVFVKKIVSDIYNEKVFEYAKKNVGNKNPEDAIPPAININKCFKGTKEILTTGDIIEYNDEISKERYFCLYIQETENILAYSSNDDFLKLIDYPLKEESIIQTGIWINPQSKI